MESIKASITNELLSWPGVTVSPHRFGGIEFTCNGKEIGHLHGEFLLDMLFPKNLRNELVAAGRAEPHHIYPESGWISFYIRKKEDVQAAIELCRLNYERICQQKKEETP